MSNKIGAIVIECIREDDGVSIGWELRVEGCEGTLLVGHAPTLERSIESLREYLKATGYD